VAAHKPATGNGNGSLEEEHGEAPHAEQPGERRAIWLITRVESIQEDPDMTIDARQMLAELPPLSQRYLALLLREGPVSNATAAVSLKVDARTLETAVKDLEAVVRELTEDED
jgi:hypothetical protein